MNPNGLQTSSGSLTMAAGVVAKIIDPSGGQNRVTSPDVTLASEGMKHGWSVTLPNTGGQWANNFAEPWLNVEAVGTSTAEVSATMNRLLQQVSTTLDSLEQQARARPVTKIRLQNVPAVPQLYYQKGSGMRAALATLALGLGLTIAVIVAMRRLGRRTRKAKRAEPPEPRGPDPGVLAGAAR